MKFIKKFLFICLIILLCVILYLKYIEKEPLIKIFGKSCLIVVTGSMEPNILQGEIILIDERDNYKKGDIVTYVDEDDFLITHRIVEVNETTFTTKGDANNINDNSYSIDRIQGKVIFHSVFLGKFILYWLRPICIIYVSSMIIIEIISNERRKVNNET